MPSRTTSITARSEPGARASIDPDTSTATSRSDRRSAAYQLASTWSTWCGPSTSNSGAFAAGSPSTPGGGPPPGRRSPACASGPSAAGPVSAAASRSSAAARAGSAAAAAVGSQL